MAKAGSGATVRDPWSHVPGGSHRTDLPGRSRTSSATPRPRPPRDSRKWSQPGSNRRPPACKAAFEKAWKRLEALENTSLRRALRRDATCANSGSLWWVWALGASRCPLDHCRRTAPSECADRLEQVTCLDVARGKLPKHLSGGRLVPVLDELAPFGTKVLRQRNPFQQLLVRRVQRARRATPPRTVAAPASGNTPPAIARPLAAAATLGALQ